MQKGYISLMNFKKLAATALATLLLATAAVPAVSALTDRKSVV